MTELNITNIEDGDKLEIYVQSINEKGEIEHIRMKIFSLDLSSLLKETCKNTSVLNMFVGVSKNG